MPLAGSFSTAATPAWTVAAIQPQPFAFFGQQQIEVGYELRIGHSRFPNLEFHARS